MNAIGQKLCFFSVLVQHAKSSNHKFASCKNVNIFNEKAMTEVNTLKENLLFWNSFR